MNIRLVILDVDGVLTSNEVYVDSNGMEFYCFNKRDGKGVQFLKEAGIKVIAITSEKETLAVSKRLEKLGIDYHFDIKNKKEYFLQNNRFGFEQDQVAFMGDDIQDIELLEEVGLAFCPKDAYGLVVSVVNIRRLASKGGNGAVREMSDYIVAVNSLFE